MPSRLCALIIAVAAFALPVTVAAAATPKPPKPGTTMKVKSTAYAGHQATYTGAKTRHGICAVDPKVIPLGTRFRVPGYGICLAADIGGAVKGAFVDVWVKTERTAQRWGVRTVTIRFL
jgi:3D (Asp-Asp-Asp) domain-containing protein